MTAIIGSHRLFTGALLAAATGMAALANGQEAADLAVSDQRCAKGADVRRIEIRFADTTGGLPCKVIYRPEKESDTLGIVSWQNIDSLDACRAQAEEVVGRLTSEGWTCAADQTAGGVERAAVDVRSEESASPAEAAAQALARLQQEATLVPRSVNDGEEGALEGSDVTATLVDDPDMPAPPEDLVALIRDDLERLDATLDGVLKARVAGYSDLNADDADDALVLYTYVSPQPAYRQFLAAYVFDGETYQLTATKPVSGNSNATRNAEIEAIDRGVVHLTLQAFEPGDSSCCPSGTRRLALALRDLDLVEIDADVPTR